MTTTDVQQQTSTAPNTDTATMGEGWKTRTYLTGTLVGTTLGLVAAYLFVRAGEENEEGRPEALSTGTLIGITLSLISLLRQIAESGKKKDEKSGKKR